MKFTWGIFPVREVKTASSWVSLLNAKRSSWNKGKKRWQQLPLLWLQFFFQLWGDSLNEAPNAFSKRNVCFDFFLTFGHQILTSETSNSNGRPIEDEWLWVSRNGADTALWNIFPRNWSSMHTIFYPTKLLLFCLELSLKFHLSNVTKGKFLISINWNCGDWLRYIFTRETCL